MSRDTMETEGENLTLQRLADCQTLQFGGERKVVGLGRSLAGNQVVCDSPLVSSYHLNFIKTTIGWIVLDLGSSRGTWVNSVKLRPNQVHWLLGNDVVSLGTKEEDSLAYQVISPDQTYEEEEDEAAPPPEDFLDDFYPDISKEEEFLDVAEEKFDPSEQTVFEQELGRGGREEPTASVGLRECYVAVAKLGTRLLSCDHCDFSSLSSDHLDQHIRSAHIAVTYYCASSDCDWSSEVREDLEEHQLTCPHINTGHSSEVKTVEEEAEEKQSSPGKSWFSCPDCDSVFRSKYSLMSHKQRVHVGRADFSCEHCDKSYYLIYDLKKHLKKSHNIDLESKIKKCKQCDFTARTLGEISRHNRLVHSGYECEICGKKLKSEYSLATHKKTVHERKEMLTCDYAGCTFQTMYKSGLRRHKEDLHDEGELHSCSQCDYSSTSLQNFRNHRATHSTERFYCDKCTYETNVRSYLVSHLKVTHSELEFFCDKCDYKASNKVSLKDHDASMHQERKYICETCGAKFHKPAWLRRHIRDVHNETLLMCEFCDYKTLKQATLKIHRETKHLGTKYNCDQCDFTAGRKSHVRVHKEVVHDKKRYPCQLCDYVAERKMYLNYHMRSMKHGGPGQTWFYKGKSYKRRPHVKKKKKTEDTTDYAGDFGEEGML